ncbi:unnamed protein product [Choristocarpus tenellus]
MIEEDYADLLSYAPPSAGSSAWTFRARILAPAFAVVFAMTPVLCAVLYLVLDLGKGSTCARIPTLTRLGMYSPAKELHTAGMHLSAILAIALFWCVRLAHKHRLEARTGVARYDRDARQAKVWVSTAWVLGSLGSVCLFIYGSLTGDSSDLLDSPQDVTKGAFLLAFVTGGGAQALCTVWALGKARGVFMVAGIDLWWYRWKVCFAVGIVSTLVLGATCTVLLGQFTDDNLTTEHFKAVTRLWAGTESKPQDILDDMEGCYSHIALGVTEYLFIAGEALFCLGLRHDLSPVRGGVMVESFVL